jgi:hypothetical protein
MDALRQFVPRDPSRDLYGAYKEAVAMIDAQMGRSPLAVGALVLVSRGPDLAGRLDRAAVQQAVDHGGERGFARIAIGVGPEAQKAPLWNLSTWEPQYLASVDELKAALGHVAEQIAALGKSFYVVSACSASRAGPHTLRIDVEHRLLAPGGKETSLSGSLEHRFEADGFGPGCDPAVPPEWGGKVTPLEP